MQIQLGRGSFARSVYKEATQFAVSLFMAQCCCLPRMLSPILIASPVHGAVVDALSH